MNKVDIALVGFIIFGLIFSLGVLIPLGLPNNPIWTQSTTGVHVTHNGQPVRELYVEVCSKDCTHSAFLTGTTDSNGVFTYHPGILDSGQPFYKVTFNG